MMTAILEDECNNLSAKSQEHLTSTLAADRAIDIGPGGRYPRYDFRDVAAFLLLPTSRMSPKTSKRISSLLVTNLETNCAGPKDCQNPLAKADTSGSIVAK